jgi:hypothetical protein
MNERQGSEQVSTVNGRPIQDPFTRVFHTWSPSLTVNCLNQTHDASIDTSLSSRCPGRERCALEA